MAPFHTAGLWSCWKKKKKHSERVITLCGVLLHCWQSWHHVPNGPTSTTRHSGRRRVKRITISRRRPLKRPSYDPLDLRLLGSPGPQYHLVVCSLWLEPSLHLDVHTVWSCCCLLLSRPSAFIPQLIPAPVLPHLNAASFYILEYFKKEERP